MWKWANETGGTLLIHPAEQRVLDLKKKTMKVLEALTDLEIEYKLLHAEALKLDRLHRKGRRAETHMPAVSYKFSRLGD